MVVRTIGPMIKMLGLASLLAACEPVQAPQTPTPPGAPIPVETLEVVLVSAPASGALRRDQLVQAARMAERDLVTVPLVLSTAQDPDLTETAQAYVVDVAGGVSLPDGLQSGDGPVIALAAQGLLPGRAAYGMDITTADQVRAILDLAKAQQITSLAVVRPAGAFGDGVLQEVKAQAGPRNISIVEPRAYPFSRAGIEGALPQLARDLRAAGSPLVLLADRTPAGLTAMASGLRERGVISGLASLQDWGRDAGVLSQPALQGLWFPASDPARSDAFARRFEAEYGSTPHPDARLAYDAVAALGALVQDGAAKGRSGGEVLSDAAMQTERGFAGVAGVFRFTSDRQAQRGLAVLQITDGRPRLISPAISGFGPKGSSQ